MNASEQVTVRRILKVNHAGEYGAIRIYRAQLWIARRWYPDLVDFLEETYGHEVAHCERFLGAMLSRFARPCRVMSLWGIGAYVLGLLTALMGRQGIWICTAAVEGTVHKHLDDQVHFLSDRDPELLNLIHEIQREEIMHLTHAEARIRSNRLLASMLAGLIGLATEIVIFLSTWGDSVRMAQDLRSAGNASLN
jgi:ubiquinone biosynthesis monooxygenase Coq7